MYGGMEGLTSRAVARYSARRCPSNCEPISLGEQTIGMSEHLRQFDLPQAPALDRVFGPP